MEKQKEKISVSMAVTETIVKTEAFDIVKNKMEELSEEIQDSLPRGQMVLFVFSSKERFNTIGRAVNNISLIKKIYGENKIIANPELGVELGQIGEHLKAISKIIEARKEKYRKQINASIKAKESYKQTPAAERENESRSESADSQNNKSPNNKLVMRRSENVQNRNS